MYWTVFIKRSFVHFGTALRSGETELLQYACGLHDFDISSPLLDVSVDAVARIIGAGDPLIAGEPIGGKHPENESWLKDQLRAFVVTQVFIGRSPLNEMTRRSGGHGPGFDGNSILLKRHKDYVFIGHET